MAMNSQTSSVLREFEEAHSNDIETITQVLAKITSLTHEQIKPHLDAMLDRLVKPQQERLFYETATAQEWVEAFQDWAESHDRNIPLLSDYAVSRESMYEDEEI